MTIIPLDSDADPAVCACGCDPGKAILSIVEGATAKSTGVTEFLQKLGKTRFTVGGI
jgi:hypothetical protein